MNLEEQRTIINRMRRFAETAMERSQFDIPAKIDVVVPHSETRIYLVIRVGVRVIDSNGEAKDLLFNYRKGRELEEWKDGVIEADCQCLISTCNQRFLEAAHDKVIVTEPMRVWLDDDFEDVSGRRYEFERIEWIKA